MFADLEDPPGTAKATAEWFGDAEEFRSHGRPVRRDEARAHSVKVVDLEDNAELQDLVLSVHHAAKLTLTRTPTTKLVENHQGQAWVHQQFQVAIPTVPQLPQPPQPSKPPALQKQAASSQRARGKGGRKR